MWNLIWLVAFGLIFGPSIIGWKRQRDSYPDRLAAYEERLKGYRRYKAQGLNSLAGRRPTEPSKNGWVFDSNVTRAGICILIVAVGACAFSLPFAHYDIAKANNTHYLIDQRIEQRDGLAALIRDEMSAENYTDLMNALPDDGNVRVWVGSGASEVLVQRASRIIALNAQVYELERDRIEKLVGVCTYVDHPMSPSLPFGILEPTCDLERKS